MTKSRHILADIRLALIWLLLCSSLSVWAQTPVVPAGEIEFARGVGFAQMPGAMPRTLGKGLSVNEGDRLTLSDGSAAIVKLNDGTRMTLRPNSELVIEQLKFQENAPDNSMVLQLLRGGLRSITGLISKGAPNAAKIRTNTATVGIRGTDFDARICTQDCKAESAQITEKSRPNAIDASAKLVSMLGAVSVLDFSGNKRNLVEGGSVYPGDTVSTGTATKAVLAFRDESRLTLAANTEFKVDSFVFDDKNPSEGSFFLSLVRGSLRALTGVIGKANSRNVGFKTATATIGIRGTGLDMDCSAADSCSFYTWLGTIEVLAHGQSTAQTLQVGQGLFVSPTLIRALSAPTLQNLQRPDTVPVNVKQLFTSGNAKPDQEGLYVFVREGHIEVASANETIHLGRGETGFAGNDGQMGRPAAMPLFIQFDKVPMPNSPNPMLRSLMSEVSKSSSQQCR